MVPNPCHCRLSESLHVVREPAKTESLESGDGRTYEEMALLKQ